jgi:hypothetical protein
MRRLEGAAAREPASIHILDKFQETVLIAVESMGRWTPGRLRATNG